VLPPDVPEPRAVLAAFGIPGAVTSYAEVDGGWSNRVLRLRTGTGDDLAVKEIRNPWGVARWRDWLDEGWRLERAAMAAGITAPAPVLAPDGGCVAEVDRADGSGSCWVRVHRWVEGRAVPREPVGTDLARWAGSALAVVHRLALRPLQPDLYAGRVGLTTADVWPDLVARASAAGASWAADLEAHEPTARRATALLGPVDDAAAVLVHGDLDQKNLLLSDSGPVLLDWDVVVPAAPSHDLAHAALTLASWREPAVACAVLDGHAAESGSTTALRPSDLGPALASRLGWIRFTVDRALDAAARGDADVDAAGHEVEALLKDAVRRVEISEQIGEWLEGRSPA
jgi:aminoglycoside phosphotransferase (APT) family kinase protein